MHKKTGIFLMHKETGIFLIKLNIYQFDSEQSKEALVYFQCTKKSVNVNNSKFRLYISRSKVQIPGIQIAIKLFRGWFTRCKLIAVDTHVIGIQVGSAYTCRLKFVHTDHIIIHQVIGTK